MKKDILFLILIQFLFFIPQHSIAKTSAYSLEQDIKQTQSIIKYPKNKIRPFIKKKPNNIKKTKRSLLLFLLSLFCAILAANALGVISIVFILLALLFGLMGVSVGYSDWKEHKSLLAGLGFVLNLILSSILVLSILAILAIL